MLGLRTNRARPDHVRIVSDPVVIFFETNGSFPILSSLFLRQQDRLRSFHHLFCDNRIASDPFIIFSATTGSSPILSSSFPRQQDRLRSFHHLFCDNRIV